MNIHQISKVNISPDVVDGIVFWTKNPTLMLNRLNELNNYTYYFQFTLNAYGKDVEPNVPSKKNIIIPTFKKLSKMIGKEKVIWRYDPIFFNDMYTFEYHCKYFKALASALSEYTEKCTVSFLDLYKNTEKNIHPLKLHQETDNKKIELMRRFSEIAKEYGLYIDTCAENINLEKLGINHAHCIERERLERLGNFSLNIEKDKNQRLECGCVESIDIGMYNTCKNGCLYCYANYSSNTVLNNLKNHNPLSPLICGEVGDKDIIKERKATSCKNCQMNFFKDN
jgi:Domain of unknown function (DUF1848).